MTAASRSPIPFISRYSAEEDERWLSRLRAALPDEIFVSSKNVEPAARQQFEFALVAGPSAQDLEGFTGLRWVQSTWAGVETLVDLLPLEVKVVRLVDPLLTERMTEAVLAWTYYLQRDMPVYAAQQRAQTWRKQPYRQPRELTVAMLGLGELGLASAQRLRSNGFTVVGWSRSQKQVPNIASYTGPAGLEQVLAQADIIVCLLPLTPETRGLLGEPAFAKTRPGAALINFARGPIVQEDALLDALSKSQVSHAVLDVFDREPLPAGHLYWTHPQITVLPHISALTDPDSATRVVAANIERWRRTGELPQLVDRERAY